MAEEETAKGGKKKLMMIVAGGGVLALAGGAFMMKGGGKAEAAEGHDKEDTKKEAKKEELGEIIKLESITLNLADGVHYLKAGVALQLSAKANAEEIDAHSAKALDTIITVLGARTYNQLVGPRNREKVKAELGKKLGEEFEDQIVGVYF